MNPIDSLFGPPEWSLDDTERWLTQYPLPPDFHWHGEHDLPQYRLHKGYGFWLRTHPRLKGLFRTVHQVLVNLPTLPAGEDILPELRAAEADQSKQTDLFST